MIEVRQIGPMNDSVLIQRLEPMAKPQNGIITTVASETNGPILRKGVILACGPGKWVPGEWWSVWRGYDNILGEVRTWEWFPGYREQLAVKPGMTVLFNARWNDLRHAENRGSGADGRGPLERPLSYKFDEKMHLVQEADIAGIIS